MIEIFKGSIIGIIACSAYLAKVAWEPYMKWKFWGETLKRVEI